MTDGDCEQRDRIETPRLWLRPMVDGDAERVVRWRTEPSTARMLFSPPPTLEEHRQWFQGPRTGRLDYVIVRKDAKRPIGVVNFKGLDGGDTAEAGKLIGDRRSRGRGMAKESFAGWLLYGFGALGLRRVIVRTRMDNAPNIHLNRKLGFQIIDRRMRRGADGQTHPFLTMELPRSRVSDGEYFRRVDRQGFFGTPPQRRR